MENGEGYKSIKSFQDLVVYKNLYKAMLVIHKEIAPKLPKYEQYDLVSQIRRAVKAGPALIAEGFAKRYQKRHWQKYLNDAIGECNEMVNHLSACVDLYPENINPTTCKALIELYDTTCKQLTRLGQSWQDFHERKQN